MFVITPRTELGIREGKSCFYFRLIFQETSSTNSTVSTAYHKSLGSWSSSKRKDLETACSLQPLAPTSQGLCSAKSIAQKQSSNEARIMKTYGMKHPMRSVKMRMIFLLARPILPACGQSTATPTTPKAAAHGGVLVSIWLHVDIAEISIRKASVK